MKLLFKSFPRNGKVILLYVFRVLAIAVAYHLAARLGLKMAYVQINTSPVWPPTGIALAALLLLGYEYWPGISLGVLAGSLLTGADLGVALGMAIGNTLEALVGAYLLRHFIQFHNAIDRIRDVVGLAVISVFSTAISATIGTISLILAGRGSWEIFGAMWSTWWIGDLLGALVIAPVLLVWFSPPRIHLRKRQYLEGAVLLLLVTLVTLYVFGGKPPDGVLHQALIYMVFPFIIWAALRFGQYGATTITFIVSGIAIWGTVQGLGPFSLESINDSLVLLQTFMAVVSLTALILAAATLERRHAGEALQQHAEELATLNDSSRTFLDNIEISNIYRTICRLAVTRLGVDVAWVEEPSNDGMESQPSTVYGIPAEALAVQTKIWKSTLPTAKYQAYEIRTIDDIPPTESTYSTFQSFGAYPLIFSNRSIGVLKLLSRCKDFFTEDKQVLIQSYANLGAVAIQNAWLLDEVQQSNRQLHALSQRLMKAQEDERLHLSRELHDESGQLLAGLSVQLGLLDRDAEHPKMIHERVAELKETANAIQANLHRLAVNLRPASLDHLGLVTALEQLVREFGHQYSIQVEFETVGMQEQRLPLEIETALFRIVQESLTNVVLHAQATRVDVLLSLTGERISAIIEDDGIGFSHVSSLSEEQLGLFGMRERVKMLGGTLTIESYPGKGTTVKAEVPCHD